MWEAKDRLSTELCVLSLFLRLFKKKEKIQTHRDAFASFNLSAVLLHILNVPILLLPFVLSFAVMPLMLLFSTWNFVFQQCSSKSLICQEYLDVQMTICMWKMGAPTILQLPINIGKYKIGGCSMQFSAVSLCPVLFNLLLVKHAPMHKAEVVHPFSL